MTNDEIFANEFKKYRKVTYPILNQDRYLISEEGKVFDTLRCKFVPQHINRGYYKISVCKTNVPIHRLVAWEFCPNRDMKLTVDHIDANKLNNHYKNLEWVTTQENTRRARAMGLMDFSIGENNKWNRYPESLIHEICQLFVKGKTNMEVFYTITKKDVYNPQDADERSLYCILTKIRSKDVWKHVVCKYDYPTTSRSKARFHVKKNAVFSEEEMHEICKMKSAGMRLCEIYRRMGFTYPPDHPKYGYYTSRIYSICSGRIWTDVSKKYGLPNKDINKFNREYLDEYLADMFDQEYTDTMIYNSFDSYKAKNSNLYKYIDEKIKIHNMIKKIDESKDLKLSEKDLENISK